MELVRSNQSEVQTGNGYTTTLLAQVNFDSSDKTSRIVEDPNLHGDEVFVKLVVAPEAVNKNSKSSISLIRKEEDMVSGLEKTYYDTYPVSITDEGSILIDSDYYLEDTALLTVIPFMEIWLQELYVLAKEALTQMKLESESLSESLSLSESQSISESFSQSTSLSLADYSLSMSTSISAYVDSVSTSVSDSLSLIMSEASNSLSVSMSELTSTEESKVFDSLSSYTASVCSSYETLESLALQLEPIRLAHELGEVSTGDLLEQMTREPSFSNLKEDISTALDYTEKPTEALEGILVEDESSDSSEVKIKRRGLFSKLFRRKKDPYNALIVDETTKQLEAVNSTPQLSLKEPTEIEISDGAYKITIED